MTILTLPSPKLGDNYISSLKGGSILSISTELYALIFSVESCQSEVCEVKRDMIAIKHEIDSVQLVKDEIDDIRESLDRLEAESQRRKNKLLEQVWENGIINIFLSTFQCPGPHILPCIQHIFRRSWYAAIWLQYWSYKCTRTGKK